jgi:hypothetical protein
LIDEIEAAVGGHDAERDRFADGRAELAQRAVSDLAEQGPHADLAREANELGPEEHGAETLTGPRAVVRVRLQVSTV